MTDDKTFNCRQAKAVARQKMRGPSAPRDDDGRGSYAAFLGYHPCNASRFDIETTHGTPLKDEGAVPLGA